MSASFPKAADCPPIYKEKLWASNRFGSGLGRYGRHINDSATMTFETKLQNGSVLLHSPRKRKTALARLRAVAPASLKAMWADSQRHGTNKMTMRQIDALIAEVRAEQPR